MSHVFPPKAFKPEEIVDPQWLDKSLQPISEKIYGRINEQDIYGTEFPLAKVYVGDATWSYDIGAYTNKYLAAETYDPGFGLLVTGFGANGWFKGGSSTDYSQAWQLVDTCSLTIEFNDEKLWICAMLQYATKRGVGSGIVTPTVPSSDPARVQFALRIDGLIIPETVTGSYIFPDTPKQMIYKGKDVSVVNSEYDYRHVRYIQGTEGIGGAAKPVRLTYQAAVVEGKHTVDVVFRRVPTSDGIIDNDGDGSTVCLYNKQLFVLVMNGNGDIGPQTSASGVKPFDEAEVLSKASLFDNRISVVANRMNNLTYSNTERGALRKRHLPPAATQRDSETIAVGTPYTYVLLPTYQQFNTELGWVTVQDGSGNLLKIDNGGSGWNLSNNPGWLIVMANVQLWDVDNSDHGFRTTAMGCFCIRIKTPNLGYVNVMNGLTEVYNTNDAFILSVGRPDNNKSYVYECMEDVPLFLAVDTAALAANLGEDQIEHIEVSCCYWPGSNPGFLVSTLSTNGGNITAWIQER
jgi:hypothetical protein